MELIETENFVSLNGGSQEEKKSIWQFRARTDMEKVACLANFFFLITRSNNKRVLDSIVLQGFLAFCKNAKHEKNIFYDAWTVFLCKKLPQWTEQLSYTEIRNMLSHRQKWFTSANWSFFTQVPGSIGETWHDSLMKLYLGRLTPNGRCPSRKNN